MKFLTKSEVDEARRLNKLALIHARRIGDEESQRRLSQEKEALKSHHFCRVCFARIMKGIVCQMHHPNRRSMKMKHWLPICLLFMLCLSAFGAASQFGSVTIAWSYNYQLNPDNASVTSWNIYVGTNSTVFANWDGNTNTCRCYQYVIPTGTTNLQATVSNLVRGATYFMTVTPTNPAGEEGDYCNEVRAIIPSKPGKGNNLIVISVQ